MSSPLIATVIVPAHNEESGLRRLLPQLLGSAAAGEVKVIVVCNGCTDRSAAEARSFGPDVEVVELPVPSKVAALEAGMAVVGDFPVAFVDADVVLTTDGLRALAAQLRHPGVLAAAPRRELKRERVSWAARWYYDVWERLPTVQAGLFGRGVIMLSTAGFSRIAALPRFMSDDLAYSEAFRPGERRIAPDAIAEVWPARTWRALLNRRIRVVRGVNELNRAGRLSASASTGPRDLLRIVHNEPLLVGPLLLFLITTAVARWVARSATPGPLAWNRDDSSRTA
ncbi:glycosyltransferase [Cryobacterium sp. SO2]|uniref:glycosyltransferase n=1 Tax=Cryobacterium sp. SO2 TaxID=1897060 RepID=UPI00223D3D15|nr:glycosyltransferase [Cryobacterium sp. SO2]WEO76926.1 glycosyltransferase [Cryobacterium sp. SO2]